MKTEKSNKMTAQEANKKLKDFSSSFEMLGCESGVVAVAIEALEKQIGVSDMERLTMTSDKGGVAFTFDLDITCKPSEAQKILKMAKKLKSYEDAEEQGLLLKSPVTVSDLIGKLFSHNETVALWYEMNPSVKKWFWRGMAWNIPEEYKSYEFVKIFGTIPLQFAQADTINIIVKCEAEQALARMEGENEV